MGPTVVGGTHRCRGVWSRLRADRPIEPYVSRTPGVRVARLAVTSRTTDLLITKWSRTVYRCPDLARWRPVGVDRSRRPECAQALALRLRTRDRAAWTERAARADRAWHTAVDGPTRRGATPTTRQVRIRDVSSYLGQHRAPRAPRTSRRAPLWRSAIAGLLGLSVVGAASASTCAQQAVALPQLSQATPALQATAQTAQLAQSAAPSPDSGEASSGRAPAASAARAQALTRTPSRAQVAERAPAAASRSGARPAAKAKAATAKKAQKAAALGPKATLARTPAARSTQTSRVAALAFPAFAQFTWVGPVSGTRQTSGFGQRWGRLHAGLDFAGPVGTPLRAMSSGVVVHAGRRADTATRSRS